MRRAFILLLATAVLAPLAAHAAGLTIFAAASLTRALTDIGHLWQAQNHPPPVFVFDASSTLARQIEAGAPADLFISADQRWMDDVTRHGAIALSSRTIVAGNTLVLVQAHARGKPATIDDKFNLAPVLGPAGRLAVGDPAHVPAGIYAEQALRHFGLWSQVQNRLAPAPNVEAALLLVEHGETPAGIVYGSDAHANPAVAVVGLFPEASHEPIRYPAAVTIRSHRGAGAFLAFLLSPAARDVFLHYGFKTP